MIEAGGETPGPIARLGRSGPGVETLELTEEARGPWQDDAAHGGAPAALLVRAAEGHGLDDDLRLAGFSAVFLGPVPLGEVTIESEVTKPGRRQRVVSLRLTGGGRTLMDARAVLLRRGEVELPAGGRGDSDRRSPELGEPGSGREVDQRRWAYSSGPAFHRSANTVRPVQGGPDRVGPTGAAWFRLESQLVAGERPSPAQRAVAAADFGNGLAHPVAFGEYLFANCDLNLSLLRDPVGEWIGLRARTDFDSGGAGVTTTEIFDREGRVGAASQTLYLDRV